MPTRDPSGRLGRLRKNLVRPPRTGRCIGCRQLSANFRGSLNGRNGAQCRSTALDPIQVSPRGPKSGDPTAATHRFMHLPVDAATMLQDCFGDDRDVLLKQFVAHGGNDH